MACGAGPSAFAIRVRSAPGASFRGVIVFSPGDRRSPAGPVRAPRLLSTTDLLPPPHYQFFAVR